jgi:hypothetical protein
MWDFWCRKRQCDNSFSDHFCFPHCQRHSTNTPYLHFIYLSSTVHSLTDRLGSLMGHCCLLCHRLHWPYILRFFLFYTST